MRGLSCSELITIHIIRSIAAVNNSAGDIYYSCAITYDSISHKIHSILSKNKKTGYEDLENKLRDDDTLLCMFKQTYVFCNMYEGLSFRDKLRIKIGAMTMPQVSVNEEIDNMNAHEFVIKWKEFVEK